MLYFKVRNFDKFQHYKHRNPPWIRLYYDLLHDRQFFRLSDKNKWLAIGCFMLASRCDNKIPFDEEWIAKELSLDSSPDWQSIIEAEFIQPIDCDASVMLAGCKQNSSQSRVDNTDNTDNTDSTETEILSFSKSAKRSLLESVQILKFWNLQSATMHHRSLNGQEKAIVKTLRKYSPEEVCRAIERYSQVRANAGGRYRDLYAWTLGEFLTRKEHFNVERFNAEDWEAPFMAKVMNNGNKVQQKDILDLAMEGMDIE